FVAKVAMLGSFKNPHITQLKCKKIIIFVKLYIQKPAIFKNQRPTKNILTGEAVRPIVSAIS
uniref:hypothetical protein n=1 Tax=Thermophagus xiamenensis TaxID=385682 RepID=UPI000255CA74